VTGPDDATGPADLPPPAAGCQADDGAPAAADPDDLLAVALAAGQEVADAARSARLSERTAYRRLADPDFRRRVAELRGRAVDRALGRLSGTMAQAADRLKALLDSDDERVALAAARAVLEFGHRLREQVELEERVA
jgi:hypothetical protein